MALSLSESITELLQDNHLCADALGKKIGVSGSIVARWIRENKPIKLHNLIKIAQLFDCSVDFVCGRADKKGKFSAIPQTFPQRVIILIEESTETKGAILNKIGLNYNIVYTWSKGITPLSSSLIALADYFRCSVDYLIGISDY